MKIFNIQLKVPLVKMTTVAVAESMKRATTVSDLNLMTESRVSESWVSFRFIDDNRTAEQGDDEDKYRIRTAAASSFHTITSQVVGYPLKLPLFQWSFV